VAWCGRASLFRVNALVDRIDRKAKSPLVRSRKRTNEQNDIRRARGVARRLRALPAHAHRQPQPPPLVEQRHMVAPRHRAPSRLHQAAAASAAGNEKRGPRPVASRRRARGSCPARERRPRESTDSNRQRHAAFRADFEASRDRLACVLESFGSRCALADAARDRRTFHDPHPVFIAGNRGDEFHK